MNIFRSLRLQMKLMTRSLQRFPLAILSALLAAVFFHMGILNENTGEGTQFFRLGLSSVVAFFVCLSAYLFIEGLRPKVKNRNMIIAVTWFLGFLAIGEVYFRLGPVDGIVFKTLDQAFFYLGILAVCGVLVFFMGRINIEEDYPIYVVEILSAISVAFVYSVVLFMGLAFIFLALNLLLGLFREGIVYPILALYTYMPFMASIFLSRFPNAREDYSQSYLYPILSSLIGFIVVPLLGLYTGILYIYLGKIILTNSLPNSSIVHLIFWSQLVAVGILFITKAIKKDKLIGYFRKFYPGFSIPLILLMFYALSLRISQYGITENRYMIGAVGLWILLSMVFFITNREKENYQVVPQLLVIFFFVAVAGGPVSASDLSLRSQEARLHKILMDNNMLRGDEVQARKDLSQEDQYEVTQITSYLLSHFDSKNFNIIDEDFKMENMVQVFGFEPQYDPGNVPVADASLSYYLDGRKSLDISGFDRMIRVADPGDNTLSDSFVINKKSSMINVQMIDQEQKLRDFTLIDLNMVREKLATLKGATYDIKPEDLAMEGMSQGLAFKIYFTDLYFPNGNKDNQGAESCSFIILTKELEGKEE